MTQFSSLHGELLSIELGSTDSTELFTTQRRQSAILEGEREFADLTECVLRESSVSCSNGVREYNLHDSTVFGSTDFLRLSTQSTPEYRVVSSQSTASGSTQIVGGESFLRYSVGRLDWERPGWRDSTGSATPDGWYLRANGGQVLFGFVQPPTIQSSESGTLRIPYVPRLTQSSNSTSEPFTISSQVRFDLRPYHHALVHYGAHRLEKLRKNADGSDRQLQVFLGYVQRYLQQNRPKHGGRVRMMQHYFRKAHRATREVTDPRRD